MKMTCTTLGSRYVIKVIKGEKEIDFNKNHDYTILRQVFDMARDSGDDWVEDRFHEGKGKKKSR